MRSKQTILFIAIILCTLFFVYCNSQQSLVSDTGKYLNHNDTVKYVGSEACQNCHAEIYASFMETGMGESFDLATPQKSASHIDEHTIIRDSLSDLFYKPYWNGDSLMVHEFRLEDTDTVHSRFEHIKYVVGSGHHTNSHIYERNGYLFQAPITFYTQDEIWDFAPGFDGDNNTRFSRTIETECMNCHNSYPEHVNGSENKYSFVDKGIGCERCHGPGEAHIKLKLAGEIIDTSKYIDYSIVNPSRLPRELHMNVCQRCHLQGLTVLKDDHDFFDYKPGQKLDDYMEIFLPEYDGPQTKFIMASQAHRLSKSFCFQESDMTCISCHNPHVSTRVTAIETFNAKCINCHTQNSLCSAPESEREAQNNNCSGCHMQKSPSIDIPHVMITDHFIRKPLSDEERAQSENFTKLAPVVGSTTDANTQAIAYLSFYDKFTNSEAFLDSAQLFLEKISTDPGQKQEAGIAKIWLQFNRADYAAVRSTAESLGAYGQINDPWTLYRVGQSLDYLGEVENSRNYLQKAVDLKPYNLDFNNKLGIALVKLNELKVAEKVLSFVVSENPGHVSSLTNLGYVHLLNGQVEKAEEYYQKALSYNPDHWQAILNMIGVSMLQGDKREAGSYIDRAEKIDPENKILFQIKEQLKTL